MRETIAPKMSSDNKEPYSAFRIFRYVVAGIAIFALIGFAVSMFDIQEGENLGPLRGGLLAILILATVVNILAYTIAFLFYPEDLGPSEPQLYTDGRLNRRSKKLLGCGLILFALIVYSLLTALYSLIFG